VYGGSPGQNFGYRYRDNRQTLGPIKLVTVRNGGPNTVSAVVQMPQPPLSGDPSPVTVTLSLGATRYCMSFGGTMTYAPNRRFAAVNAPAPAECVQ
jgi:hypothetical protein